MQIIRYQDGVEVAREWVGPEPTVEQAIADRMARIKAEAYDRIRALEGDAADPLWKRRRAEDRAALGDDTELTALRQAIEAVRQASNQAEADVTALDDVAAINGFAW